MRRRLALLGWVVSESTHSQNVEVPFMVAAAPERSSLSTRLGGLVESPRLPHEKATRHVHPALILSVLSIAGFPAQLDVWMTNVGLQSIGRGVGA